MVNVQKAMEKFWEKYESEAISGITVPTVFFYLLNKITCSQSNHVRVLLSEIADAVQVSKPIVQKAIKTLTSMHMISQEVKSGYLYVSLTDEVMDSSSDFDGEDFYLFNLNVDFDDDIIIN
mgnify:CR=1 FL=1